MNIPRPAQQPQAPIGSALLPYQLLLTPEPVGKPCPLSSHPPVWCSHDPPGGQRRPRLAFPGGREVGTGPRSPGRRPRGASQRLATSQLLLLLCVCLEAPPGLGRRSRQEDIPECLTELPACAVHPENAGSAGAITPSLQFGGGAAIKSDDCCSGFFRDSLL